MFEDECDDPADDGDADHPHRMDEPHPADAWKHGDDHHHVEVAEGSPGGGVGVHFVVFLDYEAVDEDAHEELVDAAVLVEVAGQPEQQD